MKIRLRTWNNKYVSTSGSRPVVDPVNATAGTAAETEEFWLVISTPRIRTGDRGTLRTTVYRRGRDGFLESVADHYNLTTVDSRGRRSDRLFIRDYNRDGISAREGDDFEIVRFDAADGRSLADGQRIALRFVEAARTGFLSADSIGTLRIIERDTPQEHDIFTLETMSDLKLYWSASRADNFSTATGQGASDAESAGYVLVRTQGRVHLNPGSGRRPLRLLWHAERGDNRIVATEEGVDEALAEGYVKVRIEGHVFAKPDVGLIALRSYWRAADRNDSFTTTSANEERDAASARYEFVRDEGHLLPVLELVPPNAGRAGRGTVRTGDLISANKELLRREALGGVVGSKKIDLTLRDPIRITTTRRKRGANKRALVLSGGGAKGCFEVGAVRRLWEQGYRPDIICGVSVGALNACKLAEGQASSAEDLKRLWDQLSPSNQGGRAIYSKNYFVDLLLKWLPNMLSDGIDDALGGRNIFDWFFYAAAHLHAIHSMNPLRNLIHGNLNPAAIRSSGIKLRVGMTDLETGQYFSVTEPFEAAALGLNICGRVDVEPDHRAGETWLTRPIFGADAYAMNLEDAVYASCILPVFMDPKIVNLRHTLFLPYRDERIALLRAAGRSTLNSTYSPPALERLLRVTRGGTRSIDDEALFTELKNATTPDYDLGQMLQESFDAWRGDSRQAQHHIFDGGLRDTMAIRTAMRLGAREITVVTGDRLQTAQWSFKNPGNINTDAFALPVAQYLFGLLGLWFNEAARTDVMLAVAQNEFLGWLYRCFSHLAPDKRKQILREFNEYWARHGITLQMVLGGSSWLGGDLAQNYGTPFMDEGCSIRYIAPGEELVDALGFDEWPRIEEGMAMGYDVAENPVELSFPVPDTLLE